MKFASIAADAGDNIIAKSIPGLRIVVFGFALCAVGSDAVRVYMRSGTTGKFHVGDNTHMIRLPDTGFAGVSDSGQALFQCDLGADLVLNVDVGKAGGLLQFDYVDKDLENL